MTVAPAAEPLWEDGAPESLSEAISQLATFPYQKRPYAARNWGHPLHSLCSYPSKMKPALAHFLVSLFTEPSDVVLDPFAGVGTIPFEACMQGRIGIANDLSPFAYMVSQAKTFLPSVREMLDAFPRFAEAIQTHLTSGVDTSGVDEEIAAFFHPDTLREVVAARHLVGLAEARRGATDALFGAAIAHILHGNRPYALSRRSHPVIPIPPKGEFVYKSLLKSLSEKLARLELNQGVDRYQPGQAYLGDAGKVPLDDQSVDAIITSPPFLGTTEFLRQNRVRLWFCGMDLGDQIERKPEFIEYDRTLASYTETFAGWSRLLRQGGRVIMHLGVVRKRDMARELTPGLAGAGFEVVDVVYEAADHLESHGRTDRGATHTHQILVARKP